MSVLKGIAPEDIERLSFSIIEEEFKDRTGLSPAEIESDRFAITRRVIHATGDFSFAGSLAFHAEAITAGIASIRAGKDIFIDVGMGAAGINRRLQSGFGGSVICSINDPGIAERAKEEGKTRTETALRAICDRKPGIIAVGNAPTALICAMELIEEHVLKPELVIGVPVGFVNASESKDLLASKGYPYITNIGRKGGSAVAVAIINALLKLA
jgi:precorrin-8X/cobalt-precorrin-8 methylmutase